MEIATNYWVKHHRHCNYQSLLSSDSFDEFVVNVYFHVALYSINDVLAMNMKVNGIRLKASRLTIGLVRDVQYRILIVYGK